MTLTEEQLKLKALIKDYYEYEETQVAPVELKGYHSWWPKYELDYPDPPEEQPLKLGDVEIYDYIFSLITKLSSDERKILYYMYEDYSPVTISKLLGIKLKEVEVLYRKALDNMLNQTTLSKLNLYFYRLCG